MTAPQAEAWRGGRGHRRHLDHGAQREGRRGPDVQARVRVPPLLAYLDHGPGGTGEALAGINRRGNANAGTAADHLAILDLIENQLTPAQREALVIRTDTAACSHAFLDELTTRELG